nr:putative holin-like toxin [Halalkalibacter urbisdiaboli]
MLLFGMFVIALLSFKDTK